MKEGAKMRKRFLMIALALVLCFAFATTASAATLVSSRYYEQGITHRWDTGLVTRPSNYSQWAYIRDANYLSCVLGTENDTYPLSRSHQSVIVYNEIALSSAYTVSNGSLVNLSFSTSGYSTYSQVGLRIRADIYGDVYVYGYVRGYV